MAEKDKQLVSQSEDVQQFIKTMQKHNQQRVDEIQNPAMRYQTEFQFPKPEEIALFPKSQTAQTYMTALKHFLVGFSCLRDYGKDIVENENDCSHLESGYRAYAFGYVLENLMIGQFPPPDNTMCLLEQYLKLRPNDVFAEYFKLRLFQRIEDNTLKKLMENIVAAEKLAHKLELRSSSLSFSEKIVLSDIYMVLGSEYTTTAQYKRAVKAFEQAQLYYEKNTNAIFGIAYTTTTLDPKKSETFLFKYLDIAPVCDKKYPHVLYQISMFYLINKRDKDKVERFFKLAQLYEKHRLPFLPKVRAAAKDMLTPMMALRPFHRQEFKYCFNPVCRSDSTEELKACTRCKSVYYCGRDCQKKDWDFHKQACRSEK